jgi:hypothetical protein
MGVEVNPDGMGDLAVILKSGSNTAVMWLRATQNASVVTFVSTNAYTDSTLPWAPATTRAY